MNRELQRLNMNMPAGLIKEVDDYANRMNLNRTSAMIYLVSSALEQKNAMSVMEQLLDRLGDIEERVMLKAEE